MKKEDALKNIPDEGFIKTGPPEKQKLSSQKKTALIRKGNELFNKGDVQTAKRIFLATGYSYGLERIGDHYRNQGEPYEAVRMFWLAPSEKKKEQMVDEMVQVLRTWLSEEG